MPMERERYPKDWEQIAFALKEEAGWRCEECGKQCRRPGEPFVSHRYTLTVAHLNHTPEDCRRENLRCLCAPCHLKYDKEHHAETRRRHRRERQTAIDLEAVTDAISSRVPGEDLQRPHEGPRGAGGEAKA